MNMRKFKSIFAEVKRNLQAQEEAFEAFDSRFSISPEVIDAKAMDIALSKLIGDMING